MCKNARTVGPAEAVHHDESGIRCTSGNWPGIDVRNSFELVLLSPSRHRLPLLKELFPGCEALLQVGQQRRSEPYTVC